MLEHAATPFRELIHIASGWEIVDGNPNWRGQYDEARNRRFIARLLMGHADDSVDLQLSLEARFNDASVWFNVLATQVNAAPRPSAQLWMQTHEGSQLYFVEDKREMLFRTQNANPPELITEMELPNIVDVGATIATFVQQVASRDFSLPKIIPKYNKLTAAHQD